MRWSLWALAAGLLWVLSGPGSAQPQTAMVLRVQGQDVVLNRGTQDGLTPGSRFVVMRSGEVVGELEVTLVDGYQAQGRLVQGQAAVGDVLRAGAADTAVSPSQPAADPGTSPGPASGPPVLAFSQEQLDRYQERYQEHYRGRTATRSFEAVSEVQGDSGMDALGWYNVGSLIISGIGPYGYTFNPQIMAATAGQAIMGETFMADNFQNAQVEVTLTVWDEGLVDSYADYTAYRESRGNLQQMAALKSIVYSQKGAGQNLVCEVKLRNTGPVVAQLSPFNFHIFLLSGSQRVQAQRYDQVLDKALNPGEEVLGYVYFPRLPGSSGPRISLEDILGNREEVSFGN